MTHAYAMNSYTQLRAAGLTPEYASKLAAEWALADLEVVEWKFGDGEFRVTFQNGATIPVHLGGRRD